MALVLQVFLAFNRVGSKGRSQRSLATQAVPPNLWQHGAARLWTKCGIITVRDGQSVDQAIATSTSTFRSYVKILEVAFSHIAGDLFKAITLEVSALRGSGANEEAPPQPIMSSWVACRVKQLSTQLMSSSLGLEFLNTLV